MRVNVYTEELLEAGGPNKPTMCEIVNTEYVSSRTGETMRNYGVRVYLKSHPDLHYVPPRDDDRSAVTFWCGPKEKDCIAFLEMLRDLAYSSTLNTWRAKTEAVQMGAERATTIKQAVSLASEIQRHAHQLNEQGMSDERLREFLSIASRVALLEKTRP